MGSDSQDLEEATGRRRRNLSLRRFRPSLRDILDCNRHNMTQQINKKAILEQSKEDNYLGDIFLGTGFMDFLNDPHIEIEGLFQYGEKAFFIFKRIVAPDEVKGAGIFAEIKLYGSSGKYKGVIGNEGKVIFEPTYLSISQFVGNVLLVKDKTEKYGLITLSGQTILPCSYDAIYPYRELVFGACKDGKVGFLDITGKEVIPFKYLSDNRDTIFSNGLACVLDEGGFIYIDHQGAQYFKDHYRYHEDFGEDGCVRNEVCVDFHPDYRVDSYLLYLNGDAVCVGSEYQEDMKWLEEHNLRCYSQDENTDSDILDAYEGDPSARWNTD